MPKQPKPHPLDPTVRPVHVIKRPPSQTFSRSEIMQPLARAPKSDATETGVRTPTVVPIRTPTVTGAVDTMKMRRRQGKAL